ncbi:MAG TPA: hypothetical protein VGO71_02115 [Baekduia sp.]|nr:hypothetical protein [Baekduia sp.]
MKWSDALHESALRFVWAAAFPNLARRLRWPTRLRPRGLVLYIAFNAALGLAVRAWAVPFFKRLGEQREQAKQVLRQQLGREPTDEELGAHLLAASNVRDPGQPTRS